MITYLHFDETAQAIIAARQAKKADLAMRVGLQRLYARGEAPWVPMVRWTTVSTAARAADLVRLAGPGNVPLFIEQRLWRYLVWHPLPVVGQRFGPFARLLVAVDPLFGDDLLTWERHHPAVEDDTPSTVSRLAYYARPAVVCGGP